MKHLKTLCKEIVEAEDSALSDLCGDILRDSDFPWDKSIKEIWEYLDRQCERHGEYLRLPIMMLKHIHYHEQYHVDYYRKIEEYIFDIINYRFTGYFLNVVHREYNAWHIDKYHEEGYCGPYCMLWILFQLQTKEIVDVGYRYKDSYVRIFTVEEFMAVIEYELRIKNNLDIIRFKFDDINQIVFRMKK